MSFRAALSTLALASLGLAGSACAYAVSYGPRAGPLAPPGPPPAGPSAQPWRTDPSRSLAPARAPDPDVRTADPQARVLFLRDVARPAAPLAEVAPPMVAALGLENTALGEANGMTPATPILVANLAEGQRATAAFTIGAGECATFLGQGGLGIAELDLFFTLGQGAATQVLAEDPTSGPIAVIGGRPGCFRNEGRSPLAGDLQARARRGAGFVLVRAYRRP